MQSYRTQDGDVLDGIIHSAYGVCTDSMLRAVLEANPGLADQGALLPAGLLVRLPDDMQETDKDNSDSQAVHLWD
ncbi:tail protein X [Acetobacteraceae bacterium ESL0709]|nr:tail protein X [Acetobacteraceae bacterium ESL0697]MDF7677371.1 tail protein X [Acetobacteraceae bacterium ESL0709]